ncbi:MAG: hypothetical protein ACWA44_10795 [Thiotrichales bacterium]
MNTIDKSEHHNPPEDQVDRLMALCDCLYHLDPEPVHAQGSLSQIAAIALEAQEKIHAYLTSEAAPWMDEPTINRSHELRAMLDVLISSDGKDFVFETTASYVGARCFALATDIRCKLGLVTDNVLELDEHR